MPNISYNLLRAVGAPAIYRRMRAPTGAVLMCHSVGPALGRRFDPNGKWRITPELLETVIACAHEAGFEAVTMDAMADNLDGGASEHRFYALTFDDGYADNLYAALPVCQRNRVPMTTYVTSGFVQRKHVAWWHLIEHLIADHVTIQVRAQGELTAFDCTSWSAKQKTFDRLAQWLTLAGTHERSGFVEDVCNRYGRTSRTYAENLFFTEAELREFSRGDYAHVGVHGASHCAFASLAHAELEAELRQSSAYLTALTDATPRHLAYPYGSPATVTARDLDVACRHGFITGLTTRHGCLSKAENTLLALPRIPVFPTDTTSSLRCKLSGLTTLLARWRRQ